MNDKKILAVALAVVTLAAVYGFVRPGPTVVEATEFRLVDSDGSVLAVLKKGDKGARLVFQYDNAEPAIIVSADDGPSLWMFNGGQIPIVGLGGSASGGLLIRHKSGFGSLHATFDGDGLDPIVTFSGRNKRLMIGGINREFAIYDQAHTKRFAAGYYWENIDRATTRDWVSLRWFAPNGEDVVKEITADSK